jgi:predicted anti-sigma-YlaC factor YlaD
MTCRDAAPLISQAMDRPLDPVDRAAVGLHLAVCPPCRRYRGQLLFVRRLLEQVGPSGPPPRSGAPQLSVEARARIRQRLEQPGT